MENNKGKKIFLIIISITMLLVTLIGATFAWFDLINDEVDVDLVTTGTLQIRYTDTSNLYANNLKPATDAQVLEAFNSTTNKCIYVNDVYNGVVGEQICAYKTFTITNIGSLTAYVDVLLEDITNTYVDLKYALFETVPQTLTGTSLTDVSILVSGVEMLKNTSKTYTLLIWLDERATLETITNKSFGAKITANAKTSNVVALEDPSNANRPVLADGMIPVKYDGTKWVKADATGDYNKWYDYGNKQWANAVMVSTPTRATYMNADVGEPVLEADILAYYVWIPRYKYQLFNVEFSRINFQLINVEFERGIASTGNVTCSTSEIGEETCTNKANGNWYTHPAFTFGNEQLKGIWVGKFETTYGTITTNSRPNNVVYATPTIKPDVTSLRNQQISKQFETAQYFGTSDYLTNTGVNEVDAHMMKNMEWGAVAYLKQSVYGLGLDKLANNDSSYLTGKSSGDPTLSVYSAKGSYSYDENKDVKKIKEGTGTNVSYNITNDTTYPWIQLADGTYKSQTQGVGNSTTNLTVTFTLANSGVVSFDYSVSSESASWDYLYYTITNGNGTVIDSTGTSNKIGGTGCGTSDEAMSYITKIHNLEPGSYTVVFTYIKDGSGDIGTDAGYVKNINVLENPEFIVEVAPAGQLASTTGNVTGVYDMRGGSWENVMGVIQDNTTTSSSPMSGSNSGNSGYIGQVYNSSTGYADSGNTLAFPNAKYYDLYVNRTKTSDYRSHLGDASGETVSWYGQFATFATATNPWFVRGSDYNNSSSGGLFSVYYGDGNMGTSDGFRVVLSPIGL